MSYEYTDKRLSKITDVLGNETVYEYNAKARLVRTLDAAGRETLAGYNSSGDVVSVVDKEGNGHFFEYDFDKTQKEYYARIKSSSGKIKEVWYTEKGETKKVMINGRRIQQILQDGRDYLITDEKGRVTRKEYDERENLTKIVYPDGEQASFEYDLRFNKVKRVVDPLGRVTELSYDDYGNLTQKVEALATPDERRSTFTYNGFGQILSATLVGEAVTTLFTYDAAGNLSTITDPEGKTIRLTQYDNMGNLLQMVDARNNEWQFDYDGIGRLTSQTDPLLNRTSYEYDGANNRTAVINALLKRFEFEYDDHNNIIKAIDPYTKYIAATYNTDNLATLMTDPEGKSSEAVYDNEGRITRSVDGAGNAISYEYEESMLSLSTSNQPVRIVYPTNTRALTYDRRGRVVEETDIPKQGESRTRRYTYDAIGNVLSVTDEEENITRFEYDALNRLVKTTDPAGETIERSYDRRDNLLSLQDPNKGITYYEYDKNNRLNKIIRPMRQATTFEYDDSGNRTAVNDAKGQRIEYDYSAVNRITRARYYATGNLTTPVKVVDFTYDKLGNIKSYADGVTSATYTYDDLQRKTAESVNYGPFSLSYSYTYYANGLKKSFTGPNGVPIDYSYDENNRLAGIGVPGEGQISYAFDAAHWNSPATSMLPGGSKTEYAYDPLMRLKFLTAKDPAGNTLLTRDHTYSFAGNMTAKATEHGNYTYQYDQLHQLTQAVNPALTDEAYTYDPNGNRLTDWRVTGNWNYNANNELQGFADTTFNFDANGNTTQKTVDTDSTHYIYDIEDRLVRVENNLGATVADYYYDPFGRRLWKEVDGTRTYFLYSDEGLIGEYNASGAETKSYGYVPDSSFSTDPLFVKTGGTYYWYQNDHLGIPQKIIRTNGQVVWDAVYDAFGNILINTESINSNLRLPGQYFDAETGLYYNYNRYYDPKIGRYLRTDPFGDGINLYAYCFNNPINFMDPMGLCAINNFFTLQGQADFWAGFGDVITLGRTKWLRDQWDKAAGLTDTVNYNSFLYGMGGFNAEGVGFYLGGAALTKLGGKFLPQLFERFASKGTTEIIEGAVSAGVRTEARNLAEQLTLKEAQAGAGQRIMQGGIKDPRFPADTWAKMQHVHKTPEGQNTVIHYWQRLKDGFSTGFKFKD
ncbi:MAG: RHS repeat-associated core domain-containing protein [Pseudomonadota bacterium]